MIPKLSLHKRSRPYTTVALGETICLATDGGAASGGVALVDDHNIDGIPGLGPLRYLDFGKWEEANSAPGATTAASLTHGLAYRLHNVVDGLSGMRTRKSFQSPNRNASAAIAVPFPPWRRLCLQLVIAYGQISNAGGSLNYQFGFDTNTDAANMTGGDLIAFRIQANPSRIEAVVRLGAGTTAVTLANSTDDDFHLYEIEVFMARAGVNPDGPNFYIDGALVQAFTASEGNVPRGPYYAKMGHATKPAPSISMAWAAVWYDHLRSVLL